MQRHQKEPVNYSETAEDGSDADFSPDISEYCADDNKADLRSESPNTSSESPYTEPFEQKSTKIKSSKQVMVETAMN